MANQGSGGAYEISQRMTAMVGWGATADFREDWTWDQAAETYALDPAMAEKLRKNNPQVNHSAAFPPALSLTFPSTLCMHKVYFAVRMTQPVAISSQHCVCVHRGPGMCLIEGFLPASRCCAGVCECCEAHDGGIWEGHVECE